jgi:hypothetical protein
MDWVINHLAQFTIACKQSVQTLTDMVQIGQWYGTHVPEICKFSYYSPTAPGNFFKLKGTSTRKPQKPVVKFGDMSVDLGPAESLKFNPFKNIVENPESHCEHVSSDVDEDLQSGEDSDSDVDPLPGPDYADDFDLDDQVDLEAPILKELLSARLKGSQKHPGALQNNTPR